MSPSIISSGFRRSGIYPFNPDAIDYGMATDTDVELNHNNEEESELCLSKQCDHEEQTLVDLSERHFTPEQQEFFNRRYEEKYDVSDPKWLKINHPEGHPDVQVCSTEHQFQEELFNRRYEEKYNLPDPIYFEWLKINHPESHPDNSSLSDHFAIAADDIFLQDSDPLAEDNSLCLVNSGANIVRQTITSLPEEVREDEPTKVSQAASDTEASPSSSSEHASRYLEKGNSKEVSSSNDSCLGPSHVPSSTMAAVHNIPPPEHEGATGQRATTDARVLTSKECAQLIYERDEKKKKQLEEKEARKAERESKKREREVAAIVKAEQTAKRKKLAAKKKVEAAKRKEEIARKKEEAVRKKQEKTTRSATRQVDHTLSSTAKRRKADPEQHEINTPPPDDEEMQNVCCVCFRTYEEDLEEETGLLWVKCVCKCWIHEDCYSEVVMDKQGRELICPYCVV